MRLIDADELIRMIRGKKIASATTKVMMLDAVEECPTVDAAPVVRCRSCRHYNIACCSEGCGWCECRNFGTWDEWFCADGEVGTYADD